MKNRILSLFFACAVLFTLAACGSDQEAAAPVETKEVAEQETIKETEARAEESTMQAFTKNARDIPEELEVISAEYRKPAAQEGALVKLDYETWESFSYDQHSQKLLKTAWVYLPYG